MDEEGNVDLSHLFDPDTNDSDMHEPESLPPAPPTSPSDSLASPLARVSLAVPASPPPPVDMVKLLADVARERDHWKRMYDERNKECKEVKTQYNMMVLAYQEEIDRARDRLGRHNGTIYAECTPECIAKRRLKYRSFEP